MRLLISIMILVLIVGLAESVQLGGTTGKLIPLGSMSKTALLRTNTTNETNTTNQTILMNQTNLTSQEAAAFPIKNPMSPIPVSNKYKSVNSPNSIEANSIAYKFTT